MPKPKKSRRLVSLLLFLAGLAGACTGGYAFYVSQAQTKQQPVLASSPAAVKAPRKIKIANWNLEVFGDSKASKQGLMQRYAEVIKDYDIIFIQEIRDKDSSAFFDLCKLLPDYDFRISSRAGRSNTKEQYGLLFRKGLKLQDFHDFNPDPRGRWERPPIRVSFNIDGYCFFLYNLHADPDNVQKELSSLERLVLERPESNTTIIGDLNADGNYYNNPRETEFDSWHWLIKDSEDTTATSTNAAYDRIIMSPDALEEYSGHGINKSTSRAMSNHYPVWVEIETREK